MNNEPNLPDDDIAEEGETYANSAAENTTAGANMRSQLAEPQEAVPPAEELVEKGQYLIDYPSWLAFLGEDKRSQYSTHFCSRNDKIWGELLVPCTRLALDKPCGR